MKHIVRLYITHQVPDHIIRAQIIAWNDLLNERKIDTKVIILYNKKTEYLKKLYEKGIILIPSKKRAFFRTLRQIKMIYPIVERLSNQYERIVLQSRNSQLSPLFKKLKKKFNVTLIYDAKAGGEFGDNANKRPSLLLRAKILKRHKREKLMLKLSDHIFAVSDCLVQYFKKKYKLKNTSRVNVLYNSADSQIFYFSESIRTKKREALGISNEKVIVYSGGLQSEWQIPDQIFKLFSVLQEQVNIKLLVVTPDLNIANQYKRKYKIKSSKIILKTASLNEMNSYYNIADLGLLLRKNNIINNVAAPIKFAEYCLCGLPTLISDSVVDYARLVKKHHLGLTISANKTLNQQLLIKNIMSFLEHIDLNKKKSIANFGEKHLSRQRQIDGMIKIYTTIR